MTYFLLVSDECGLVASIVLLDASQLLIESVRKIDETDAAADVELQELKRKSTIKKNNIQMRNLMMMVKGWKTLPATHLRPDGSQDSPIIRRSFPEMHI